MTKAESSRAGDPEVLHGPELALPANGARAWRIGLFGGSFDPIHRGHVNAVRAAADALGLDRVVFLPTARGPHKPGGGVATPLARYAMVELALLGEPRFYTSAHELGSDGPSYTVETIEHFTATYAAANRAVELTYLLGTDSLANLHTWRRWSELPALATLAVLTRPGFERSALAATMPAESRGLLSDGRVVWPVTPASSLSSSAIRRALATGQAPPPGSLHPRVLSFIRKYHFYVATA